MISRNNSKLGLVFTWTTNSPCCQNDDLLNWKWSCYKHSCTNLCKSIFFHFFLINVCLVALCNPTDFTSAGSSVHGVSPSKNTGVGCHALLQGIVPTQGWNPGLPHCRWIPHWLSHQGSHWLYYSCLISLSLVLYHYYLNSWNNICTKRSCS